MQTVGRPGSIYWGVLGAGLPSPSARNFRKLYKNSIPEPSKESANTTEAPTEIEKATTTGAQRQKKKLCIEGQQILGNVQARYIPNGVHTQGST